jgi:hypothetical protein
VGWRGKGRHGRGDGPAGFLSSRFRFCENVLLGVLQV